MNKNKTIWMGIIGIILLATIGTVLALTGDANDDGYINAADLALYRKAMSDGIYDERVDWNNDGIIDSEDLEIFRRAAKGEEEPTPAPTTVSSGGSGGSSRVVCEEPIPCDKSNLWNAMKFYVKENRLLNERIVELETRLSQYE